MKNTLICLNKSDWLRWFSVVVLGALTLSACAPGTATPTVMTESPVIETETIIPTEAETPAPDVTPVQETPVHLQVEPEDLAGIVVRMVHPWVGEMAETLSSLASQFSLSNEWDIWVEVDAPGSDSAVLDAVEADMADEEIPSLIVSYPYAMDTLDETYYSVNLRDYLNDPTWGLDDAAQADVPAVLLSQYERAGNLAALPLAPQGTVIFYNQTWAQELGFAEPPNGNAEAFRQQSCEAAFSNNADDSFENDGTGGWLVSFDPLVMTGWYASFDGPLAGEDALKFDSPPGQDAFGYLKSVYDEGCFWIGRRTEPYYYFANRYAMSYAGTLDQIPAQAGWMTTSGSQDAWSVIGFPGPAGETMLVNGPGMMITADTPEIQMAAWLFARYLLSPEAQAQLVRAGFSLPVRQSAMAQLSDFSATYPQWAQAAALLDTAQAAPISARWGIGQYVLQDAVNRLLQAEPDQVGPILTELDASISELEGTTP
ncbi:MAG: extracellular solute-binding protein [Chloroflexota bacterium]|nr:extracellular solute-binding protein [Chloroflexota bacterium]